MHTIRTGVPQAVFEDDDILVVDKPGGMVCHSAQRPEYPTLVAWVREYLTAPGKTHLSLKAGMGERHACRNYRSRHANRSGQECPSHEANRPAPVRLVNRLDRETSGLVIVAKNERAAKNLGKAVLRREIEKQYLAICWGEFEQDHGVIDEPIAVSKTGIVYTKRVVDHAAGKPSVTEFEVVAALGKRGHSERSQRFTVVRLRPRTGRAHQLRVHMAWLGHPIVGDKVYGPDETLYLQFIQKGVTDEMLDKLLLPRHALHAERVSFRHPCTQQPCTFRAPVPEDMRTFIDEHSLPRGRRGLPCRGRV